MKDLGSIMKQAQAMQQRMAEAQEKIQAIEVEGTSGGGMVKLTLKGSGELARVELDESLMAPGEGEVVADLIVAAHADAKRKLDEKQAEIMREAAGPLAIDLFRFRHGEAVTAETPVFSSAHLLGGPGPAGPPTGELRRFEVPGQWVNCVALSPDERLAASGGRDRAVRVWDVDGGREVCRFDGLDGAVHAVAFSPDGRTLYVGTGGTGGGNLRAFDLSTGESRRFPGHEAAVLSVCPTPDGTGLLTGGADGVVTVWHLGEGAPVRRVTDCRDQVNRVVVSPDGREFLSASHDGKLRRYPFETGNRTDFHPAGFGAVWDAAYSPDGRRFAWCGDAVAVYPNLGRFRAAMARAARGYLCVAFLPDGSGVLAGDKNGGVSVWDLATGVERARFTGHGAKVTALAVFRDGRRALTSGGDGTLRLWGLPPGPAPDRPVGERVVPLWGICAGHADAVWGVLFLAGRLVSWSADGSLRLWDVDTGEETGRLPGHLGGVWEALALPDGRLMSCGQDGAVRVWDVAAGLQDACPVQLDLAVNCIALTPDGRHLVTGGDDRFVRLWEWETGREVRRFTGHTDEVWRVLASPDGRHLVSGGKDGTLRWWEAETGKAVRSLGGWFTGRAKGRVQALAPTPGGGFLVAGPDGPAEEWGWDGRAVRRLPAATAGLNGLAFLPDGRLLAGGGDGAVRLWDAAGTGQSACWREHDKAVGGVAVSADGVWAASAGMAGTVGVWRLPPARPRA